jgi:hypothetical protein
MVHCWKDMCGLKLPRRKATPERDRLHIYSLCIIVATFRNQDIWITYLVTYSHIHLRKRGGKGTNLNFVVVVHLRRGLQTKKYPLIDWNLNNRETNFPLNFYCLASSQESTNTHILRGGDYAIPWRRDDSKIQINPWMLSTLLFFTFFEKVGQG